MGTDPSTVPPLVSVVIPVFNGELYIEKTIESVLAQSYPSLEIIVIDDGSTDDSAAKIRRYQETDSRIQMIQQRNRGVANSRNAAIAIARGKYIAPLDADDIWMEEKISEQVAALELAPEEVGLAYAWSANIDAAGRFLGGVSANTVSGRAFADLIFSNIIGNGSAALIRKRCLDDVGGYSEDFIRNRSTGCEDRDLYLRIAEKYDFVLVPRILIGYRVVPNSMSSDVVQMNRSNKLMLNRLKRRHRRLPGRFFRQSRAFNCFYLNRLEVHRGRILAGTLHLLRAASLDPSILMESGYRRLLRAQVIRLIRALVGALSLNRKDVVRFPQAKDEDDLTLETLEARGLTPSRGWMAKRKFARANAAREWLEKQGGRALSHRA